jgi:hypothetical protein
MSLRNQPAAFFTSTFYPAPLLSSAFFIQRLFVRRFFEPNAV